MALVQGVHILAHGNKFEARKIAVDIQQHQRLLIGTNSWHGAGAYVWHVRYLPKNLRDHPQVLIEVCEHKIVNVYTHSGIPWGFFRIPGRIGDYVSIHVIAFANLDDP